MIWHVIDSRTVGGAERHIALLVRALNARGVPARALSDLAHQLLAAAASDIEAKTHVPARSLEL